MRSKDVQTNWDAVRYIIQGINPIGYLDFDKYSTSEGRKEKAEHLAIGSTIWGSSAFGVWALSGGGASMPMWFGAMRPGIRETWAVKQHVWKTIGQQAVRTAVNVSPHVPFALASVLAVDTMVQAEQGDYERTLPGLILNPLIEGWLDPLGRHDSRGGRESGLFYRP